MKMMFLLSILVISILKSVSALSSSYEYIEENVAVRGKATQSGLFSGKRWGAFSLAMHAIDGNNDPDFKHGSCSHTSGRNPWWRVDLLQTYTITSVTITNRRDCCEKRIAGAHILIGDSNSVKDPECSEVGPMKPGETRTFRCPKPMTGRYVTVYHPKTDFLHLCEVEVNALVPVECDHSAF